MIYALVSCVLSVVVSFDKGRTWRCGYFLVSAHMWFPPLPAKH